MFCFCCVRFSFSVLKGSQEIGWEERFRNDLFCDGWDVKPNLNSVNESLAGDASVRWFATGLGHCL